MYRRRGQMDENEIMQNGTCSFFSRFADVLRWPCVFMSSVDTSEEFEAFLDCISERIQLEGFQGFRGGLDTSGVYAYLLDILM